MRRGKRSVSPQSMRWERARGPIAFRPLSAGIASVRSSITGYRPLAAAVGTVTVSQPTITLATDYLG